ncbi:unnamed protein product [Mytilus coruscus]|uniref:CCHC-type domain-containing protein n=1 Tax=Mytilus coruscus TaxID=42192 RepID=A0A6J8B0B4_MYTCO|nr:unnamed protein product [Mytilus coruscus]
MKHAKKNKDTEKFRVKKLEAPIFAGSIRDYPSFKVDYERHMLSSYGKDPYALKQCLSGEALTVVKGVDNDFEEMFRRLDMKYGRAEKLIDHILNELKRLKKVQEGDNMKFISLVETVEKCWLDLKRMNLEAEMNTATMVSQIEKLLPPIQKTKRKDKYFDANESENDENNNGVAVDPLQVQLQENQQVMKQVVEGLAQVAQAMSNKPTNRYNSDKNTGTNRNTEGKFKCWYLKSDNHEIGDCSIFARLDSQTKVDLVRKNGGCFSCLKIGHLSRHCHSRKPCDIQNELHQTCGKIHHKNLHTAHIDGISFHNSTQVINNDKNKNGVLFMISSVQCKDMSLTTLWDPGANMSLITHKTAKRLGLSGQDITLSVTKVGNVTEHVQSKEYVIPLTDLRAVSRLGSTEKRLLRNSLEYASAYDEQIMDMVKRGIARKLTKEEMEIHSGPVHYIPHHEVLKPNQSQHH